MQALTSLRKIPNPSAWLSPLAWDWLSYKPSLTERLREFTQNKISFHVCSEGWNDDRTTWLRKIQWIHQAQNWIEADLTIPLSSVNPDTDCLLNTKERPIGELLFQDPSLLRSDFQFYQPNDFDIDKPKWVRVSVFHFKKQPLTLTETFFPAFFESIEHSL